MPATFNPRTAYAQEWRYLDGIEDGTLYELDAEGLKTGRSWSVKCQRSSVAESYLAQTAAQNGLNPSDTILTVWQASAADPKPKSGHAIVVAGVRWIVQSVIERRWGPVFDCVVGAPLDRERFSTF